MNHPAADPESGPAGAEPRQPDRAGLLARLASTPLWDVAVIGGGATGLGVALDAAARGFSVVLLEAEDFAKGTSSRATKLVHGGVRYLAQGDLGLVREALAERRTLLDNAAHLAQPLQFVMPVYGARGRLFDKWFYGAGLVIYDLLAGRAGLGRTRFLGKGRTIAAVPGVRTEALAGAVAYWDGIFDDARLALTLARTAIAQGACILNHCRVEALARSGERIDGLEARDTLTGARHRLRARCVINATGVWVDEVRRMDRPAGRDIVAPSQGVHLVVERSFQPSDRAILVPSTADGRVLFVVPWMGYTVLGTTDTPREDLAIEPRPFEEEIDFILAESAKYLARAPRRADVRATAGAPGRRRGRQHQERLARTHRAGRRQRPGHGHRRQVDDLPGHGRGCPGRVLRGEAAAGAAGRHDGRAAAGGGARARRSRGHGIGHRAARRASLRPGSGGARAPARRRARARSRAYRSDGPVRRAP